ncbi:MAG: hypothetical protein RLZZ364_334 [Actinomycetota bacterium]
MRAVFMPSTLTLFNEISTVAKAKGADFSTPFALLLI